MELFKIQKWNKTDRLDAVPQTGELPMVRSTTNLNAGRIYRPLFRRIPVLFAAS